MGATIRPTLFFFFVSTAADRQTVRPFFPVLSRDGKTAAAH